MKKTLVVIAILTALSMTSCKKEVTYTCGCYWTNFIGESTSRTYQIGGSRAAAEQQCDTGEAAPFIQGNCHLQ